MAVCRRAINTPMNNRNLAADYKGIIVIKKVMGIADLLFKREAI